MTRPDPYEAELLERLLGGDVTAPAELAERYLEDVRAAVARTCPGCEDQAVTSASIDAILGVAQHPDRVNLLKGSLSGYLRMAARGDLKNAIAAAGARHRREPSLEAVEVSALERNIYRSDPNADPTAEAAIRAASAGADAVDLRALASDVRELAVLRAMLEGERRTAVFAQILDISNLDGARQRAEVKKVKDRLTQRLHRLRGRSRE